MGAKSRDEVQKFVARQRSQLGLTEAEAQELIQQTEFDEQEEQAMPAAAAPTKPRSAGKRVSDPYLSESLTIQARPTRVSRIPSLFFEHALPNEYIAQIGKKDIQPVLGGRFFKIGRRFLKFPAAVQTVYFTSDNANKNYQGIKIDGYACWRVDPERPEMAARSLDFSDQDNPMGNTNRILRTICTEAIRHIIANITIEEALTKKDEIGLNLKAQLERIEREWGVRFDQVGIERVTILSANVFEDLQQKARDDLRLTASESRMETDQRIEKKSAEHTKEMEALQCETEKEARILKATTESKIHKVELDEQSKREAEERIAEEERRTAEAEAAERAAKQKAERDKRQTAREAEIEALKIAEESKLKKIRAASEAEFRITHAENEAKVAESSEQQALLKAEARNKREQREMALEAERQLQAVENEKQIQTSRVHAEIERDALQFDHENRERIERAATDHDIDIKRLERMKIEESTRNALSHNRVVEGLVKQLPDIASAISIDRYTVLNSTGDSPLTQTVAQVLSLLEEKGIIGRIQKGGAD